MKNLAWAILLAALAAAASGLNATIEQNILLANDSYRGGANIENDTLITYTLNDTNYTLEINSCSNDNVTFTVNNETVPALSLNGIYNFSDSFFFQVDDIEIHSLEATQEVGETKTYSIGGISYEVTVIVVSGDTSATAVTKLLINGLTTPSLRKGEAYNVSSDLRITILDIRPTKSGDIQQNLVTFRLDSMLCGDEVCGSGGSCLVNISVYERSSYICTIPESGMSITQSTLFCPGTYNLSKGISVTSDNLLLDCNGAIFAPSATYPAFEAEDRINITIHNCTISGSGDLITLVNSNASTISNNVLNSTNDNVVHTIYLEQSHSNLIAMNRLNLGGSENGNLGVIIMNSTGNIVRDNNFSISDEGGYGVWLYKSENNTIYNNSFHMEDSPSQGVLVERSSYTTISANTFWSSANYTEAILLGLGSLYTAIIQNNITTLGPDSYGIFLDGCCGYRSPSFQNAHTDIIANVITTYGEGSYAVRIKDSPFTNLTLNNLYSNTTFDLHNSDHFTVSAEMNYWGVTERGDIQSKISPYMSNISWSSEVAVSLNESVNYTLNETTYNITLTDVGLTNGKSAVFLINGTETPPIVGGDFYKMDDGNFISPTLITTDWIDGALHFRVVLRLGFYWEKAGEVDFDPWCLESSCTNLSSDEVPAPEPTPEPAPSAPPRSSGGGGGGGGGIFLPRAQNVSRSNVSSTPAPIASPPISPPQEAEEVQQNANPVPKEDERPNQITGAVIVKNNEADWRIGSTIIVAIVLFGVLIYKLLWR